MEMAKINNKATIAETLRESSAVLNELSEETSSIEKIADALVHCYQKGGKMVLFGNGGSAADAQHLAAELVGRYKIERPSLASLALTADTSALTSIGNDFGFAEVFSRIYKLFFVKSNVSTL